MKRTYQSVLFSRPRATFVELLSDIYPFRSFLCMLVLLTLIPSVLQAAARPGLVRRFRETYNYSKLLKLRRCTDRRRCNQRIDSHFNIDVGCAYEFLSLVKILGHR